MLALILASSSRYRRALLERLQLPFTAVSPDVDETPHPGEAPLDLVQRLGEAKARAVGTGRSGALVIGSDQVAECDGRVLGKPGDHRRAAAQLAALSGRRVPFLTSLCMLNLDSGAMQRDVVTYTVRFRTLDDATIERYLLRERPYDCAAAFKSDALGISLVAGFEGDDPTALIGLPLIRLCEMLRREGIKVP